MSKSRRRIRSKTEMILYKYALDSTAVFLVNKWSKRYMCVGGIDRSHPNTAMWSYEFPDNKWTRITQEEVSTIRYWLDKKFWVRIYE